MSKRRKAVMRLGATPLPRRLTKIERFVLALAQRPGRYAQGLLRWPRKHDFSDDRQSFRGWQLRRFTKSVCRARLRLLDLGLLYRDEDGFYRTHVSTEVFPAHRVDHILDEA